MGFLLVVSVFMAMFGAVPVVIMLLGAFEGGYEAFNEGLNQDPLGWVLLLLCFPIGLYGAWKTNKAIDKRDWEKEINK